MQNIFSIDEALESKIVGGSPFKIIEIGAFVTNILEVIIIVAAIASLVYLFWGGLEWITSGGDKAGTEKAKSKITDAVIGLVIVFSAWAIFQLLQTFLGFNITGGSAGKGGVSATCDTAKINWVANNSPCEATPTKVDWSCWKTWIEKNPCKNFNDGTGSYWPRTGCTTPANICP